MRTHMSGRASASDTPAAEAKVDSSGSNSNANRKVRVIILDGLKPPVGANDISFVIPKLFGIGNLDDVSVLPKGGFLVKGPGLESVLNNEKTSEQWRDMFLQHGVDIGSSQVMHTCLEYHHPFSEKHEMLMPSVKDNVRCPIDRPFRISKTAQLPTQHQIRVV